MHIRKYLSIFLIGLVFAIAGCSPDSTSGISEEDRLPDTDNDGIVNNHDDDIDGDGKPNQNDDDIDGDGVTNDQDGDDDGDGIPDGGDSTPEGPPSNDIDGDGIPNDKDPDKDGDGIPNDKDPDKDGDGKPNDKDPTPGGDAARTCTSAKMYPPKDGITGVLNTVSWKLGPTGCVPAANPKVVVTASYAGVTTESDPASLGDLTTNIKLPHDCGWRGTQTITYDFSEIGNALGDTTGTYTTDRRAIVNKRSDQRCEADPCTSAKIKWPTAEIMPGQAAALDWHLLPVGCALSDSQLEKKVAPTGTSYSTTTTGDPQHLDKGRSRIIVPCAPGAPEGKTEKRDIAWDFSELATALGDSNVDVYKATVTHKPAANGCNEPVPCTSVTFTAPEQAKFNSSYELTWRLSPEGCIPHNGNEKLMLAYWGFVRAPEIDNYEQLILDPVSGWPPLDGKATIDVPDSKFCSGDYDQETTSDGKVGVLGFDDRSNCDPFRIGAVGEDGTCDGLRIPLLSCP